MPILDCHVHLNNYYNEFNKPEKKFVSLEERVSALLESMYNNDVDYSIILSSYKVDTDRPSTYQIIDAIKKHNDKLGLVAGFSIDNHTNEDLKNYRKWLKDGYIKGIKIYCGYEHYYPYDERYQKAYDTCVEYGTPLMIHTGDTFSHTAKIKYSHPLNIDDVAVDNPESNIIMYHLGNPWMIDCQEILYKNRNVYADISGLFVGNFTWPDETHYIGKIKELLNYAGMQHPAFYYMGVIGPFLV
jgi:predicted TIM-barrel fold metal-dependent hydrolase